MLIPTFLLPQKLFLLTFYGHRLYFPASPPISIWSLYEGPWRCYTAEYLALLSSFQYGVLTWQVVNLLVDLLDLISRCVSRLCQGKSRVVLLQGYSSFTKLWLFQGFNSMSRVVGKISLIWMGGALHLALCDLQNLHEALSSSVDILSQALWSLIKHM